MDMLVLHYTGMADGLTALNRMRDPASEVSAHYMVEEDGGVHVLVREEDRAWHAGRSQWQGDEDLNSRSIGIEIVNGGHDFGLPAYPDVQIDAVIELCLAIQERWKIPQSRIVGHSDIAPERKDDPGERFPWGRLAQNGIGVWPGSAIDTAETSDFDIGEALTRIGYRSVTSVEDLRAVVRAFQRRWRPAEVSGEPDAETVQLIRAVAANYGDLDTTG